jgi:hypothetical protein
MADVEDRPGFTLTYGGPALADGSMSVHDLAPALMSLGDLFHEAHAVVNPDAPPISLDIRAFREGSFEVHLNVSLQEVANLLVAPNAQALANLVSIVMGSRGFFGLARLLRGREVRKREDIGAGMTKITLIDGTSIETPGPAVVLYERESARRYGRQVLDPLKREGIEELRVLGHEQTPLVVPKDEADVLDAHLEDTPLVDSEREMALTLATIAFDPDNKWRFSDGLERFWARVEDRGFLDRVAKSQEAFTAGDVLVCTVRTQQWQTESGLRTEHTVVRVLEHRRGARQLPLGLEQGPEGEPQG